MICKCFPFSRGYKSYVSLQTVINSIYLVNKKNPYQTSENEANEDEVNEEGTEYDTTSYPDTN